MKKYVTHLKSKPEYVRKRVAIGTAAGATALVGIIWIVTTASSGAFALSQNASPLAKANTETSDAQTGEKSTVSQLLGAVGAVTGATTSQPALTIVDTGSATTFKQPTAPNSNTATVLPF